MKTWQAITVAVLMMTVVAFAAQTPAVPKYDPTKESKFSGIVEEVRDWACPVSGAVGSHIVVKLKDGSTIEAHLATTKFVKAYDLVFAKGDQVEVTGTKVVFEGVETIFAREVRRGDDTFEFRDREGKPIW